MKVLVISPKFHPIVGGGETFVLNSLYQLHKAKVDVSIAVEPHPQRRLDAYPFPVYEIPGLSDTNLDVLLATDNLFNLIQQLQPDLLHVHGYFGLLAAGLGNEPEVPIIASIHSTPIWGVRLIGGMRGFEQELLFAQKILKLSEPKIITAANEVYAAAARKIADKHIKIELLPYPLLPEYYREYDRRIWRKKFSLTDADTLITLPSRIIERKGIREAIYALGHLPQNFFLCLPCASTPFDKIYWSSIIESREFKRVANRVLIPKTNVMPEDMPCLYAASDLIIMPSHYEGAPVATIEAMAAKKPFIGADSQGINGFIRNGENGLLVPAKNAEKLAGAILDLAENQALQRKFVDNAAKDVAHLSWQHQLPKLIGLYEQAIEQNSASTIR